MKPPRIPVEIFRDLDTPDVSIEAGEKGIAIVNDILGHEKLEITRSNRRMRFSTPDMGLIDLRKNDIPLDRENNILRLVITQRRLRGDEAIGTRVGGYTLRDHVNSRASAIVSVNKERVEPEFTTAHEIGHMIGARYHSEGNDEHCVDTTCIMTPSMETRTEHESESRQGMMRALEYVGFVRPRVRHVERVTTREFCNSCKEQLAKRAFFLAKHFNGESIPLEWR